MKNKLILCTLAAMSLVACQKNNDLVFSDEKFEIRATIDNEEMTKVSLNLGETPLSNVWNYGDKIYMAKTNSTEGTDKRTYDWEVFTISNVPSADKTVKTGVFTGSSAPTKVNVNGKGGSPNKFLAVVTPTAPENKAGYFNVTIPSTQIYKEGYINSGYLAMYAVGDDYSNMSFKSLNTILRVRVKATKDDVPGERKIKSIALDPGVDSGESGDSPVYHRGFSGNAYLWTTYPLNYFEKGLQLNNSNRSDGTLTLNCEPDGEGTGPEITNTEKDFYLVMGCTDATITPYGYSLIIKTTKGNKTIGPINKHFIMQRGHIYTTTVDMNP